MLTVENKSVPFSLVDRDLANLYDVEIRTLKQAVRRNIKRFPDDFMFELSRDEEDTLRPQTVILKEEGSIRNIFHLPLPSRE